MDTNSTMDTPSLSNIAIKEDSYNHWSLGIGHWTHRHMFLFLDLVLEHDGWLAGQIQHDKEYVPNNIGCQWYNSAPCME